MATLAATFQNLMSNPDVSRDIVIADAESAKKINSAKRTIFTWYRVEISFPPIHYLKYDSKFNGLKEIWRRKNV